MRVRKQTENEKVKKVKKRFGRGLQMRDAETNLKRKRKSKKPFWMARRKARAAGFEGAYALIESKKAFWAMDCEAQPAGRQGSVLSYVTEPNKGCNKADRRPKRFF